MGTKITIYGVFAIFCQKKKQMQGRELDKSWFVQMFRKRLNNQEEKWNRSSLDAIKSFHNFISQLIIVIKFFRLMDTVDGGKL